MSMVIVTIEGSSGSVVRFASHLPYEALVRDSVEHRFEEACPVHAQCAPAVVATLPPPAAPAAPAAPELTAADVRAIQVVAFDDADWETMWLCRVALGVDRFGAEDTLTEATKRGARRELARLFPEFVEADPYECPNWDAGVTSCDCSYCVVKRKAQAVASPPSALRSRG